MNMDLLTQLRTLQAQFSRLQAEHIAVLSRQHAQTQTQKHSQTHDAPALQQVFYRIAERATAGLSLHDFLQAGHELLSELMYARNFFVCLHNTFNSTLDFPYYVDQQRHQHQPPQNVPMRRGLIELVLQTGQHQVVDAARLQHLLASEAVTYVGSETKFCAWLGVPLKVHGRIIGVLAVRSYDPGILYTEADAQLMSFVANQIGSAMERYQALEALRKSEERYRYVIENVGVGVVVVQDGYIVFANPSLVRIVGHPLEFLLSHPFTESLHPDDVDAMVARHQKRLRGEPVEAFYGFRVITGLGEIRTLELSAVCIDWNGRIATLMFVVDATARQEAEQAQREAVQRQRELNDMKARFIATTSHEFRTPLATIHSSVELLRHYEERMPADMKHATLQKIDDAVERMTHMLENIMLIGRSGAGQLQFMPRPLQLGPFCRDLLDEIRGAMEVQTSNHQWSVELPPEDTVCLLDGALIRNIVLNLLSNAIKYSPAGGTIELRVTANPSSVDIVVSDHGIGIPEDDLPRLFESFHRAGNVGTVSGTGLGLFIVKEAVTMHQGRIKVNSVIDQGSTFTVTLPLNPENTDTRP